MTPNSRGHINSGPTAAMQTGLTSRTTNFTPSVKDEVGTHAVSRQRGLSSGPECGSPSAPFRSDSARGARAACPGGAAEGPQFMAPL